MNSARKRLVVVLRARTAFSFLMALFSLLARAVAAAETTELVVVVRREVGWRRENYPPLLKELDGLDNFFSNRRQRGEMEGGIFPRG